MNQQHSNLSPTKQALLEKWKQGQPLQPAIAKQAIAGPIPLSFSQQRLWFLDQYYRSSPFYNICNAIHLTGSLNITAIQRSLNEILRRHSAWRTRFKILDGQPVQVIQTTYCDAAIDEYVWELPILDLELSANDNWHEQIYQLATEEARKPFDLSAGPVVRARLLRLSSTEHVFLLTMHHIVSDGWSVGVFVREFTALYAAFSTQQPSPLPELAIEYRDFAIWQRDRLQGPQLATALNYWTQQLSGELPVLQLPTDRPRSAIASFNGAKHYFVIPKSLTTALQQLSQQTGATLFMTLLTAFNILLYRYTDQTDLRVGTPVANRNQPELAGLLGCFVNTIVMRADLGSNPSFREMLERVREVTLAAYTHQELPFEKLVETLQPDRDLSRNPLFQVMFILQNAPASVPTMPDLTLRPLEVDSGTAMFDLCLSVTETEQGLTSIFEYNTDLFDAATIARFADHWLTLLAGIVTNPDQQIAHLPILSEAEQEQLLVSWNHTTVDYPQNSSLHQLFEQQVMRSPNSIALIDRQTQITFQQLNEQANQLARQLQRLGVQPDTPVAICLDRCIDLVIGILAILKAGAAYLPLDPNHPRDRLAFMLTDSQASVVVTQTQFLEKLPGSAIQIVCLDRDPQTAEANQENLDNPAGGNRLAYVIYTSGSTGTPKGVLGTHRGTVNGLHWFWRTYPLQAHEICCQKTAIGFVDSIWEIFAPLLQGIPSVIIADAIVKDPEQFLNTLAAASVTRLILVPSLLRVLLETYPDRMQQLSQLTLWICSGEALSRSLVQRFYQVLSDAKLINFYGSSEVSANVTYFDTHVSSETINSVPIGRPIDNTQVYILDRYLQPVPIGVVGELYIGGDNLARGYLNRPQLTSEKFIPAPRCLPASLLYKTGDLARYRRDGHLEYLGRRDHQVKIRGMRVELGEIEAVIAQHPAVQAVLVLAQDTDDDRQLIAYIVSETPEALPQLHQALQSKLPEYMRPALLLPIEAIPLTPSGKIDRVSVAEQYRVSVAEQYQRSLPALPTHSRSMAESPAPRDLWELALVKLWENLLPVRPIGVLDNFFDLGGHSLLAVRLMAQIQAQFGQHLPLSTLFEGATIAELAKRLRQQIGSGSNSPLIAIRSTGSPPAFFCVHPAGGNIIAYPNLANQLDAQPFYAFEQTPQQQRSEYSSVEQTAACYVEEMRRVQPHGPYCLGGWCYGGIVAFEMAHQLRRQGEIIQLLAVFDAIAPAISSTSFQSTEDDDARLLVRIAESLKHFFNVDVSASYDELRPLSLPDQFRVLMQHANSTDAELEQHLENYQLFKRHVQAMRRYLPQVYPGEITLFRAIEPIPQTIQNPEFWSDDRDLGWGRYTSQPVQVIDVPGNHFSMFSNLHIPKLADQLRKTLNKCRLT